MISNSGSTDQDNNSVIDLVLTREQVKQLQSETSIKVKLSNGQFVHIAVEKLTTLNDQGTVGNLGTTEKIRIFAELFNGREDVFAIRWENHSGKSGYSPACENQWKPGICGLPKVKCADCANRQLSPLTSFMIERHLRGELTIGVYPLLPGNRCSFLAFDCDGQNWQDDSTAILSTCRQWEIPAYRERSRSGNGAHIWIFFDAPHPAAQARTLGSLILTATMETRSEIGLGSYDRMFPNQDFVPEGGFGNLIALPLQKIPRQAGNSVFIDDHGIAFTDQWGELSKFIRMNCTQVQAIIEKHYPKNSSAIGLATPSTDGSLDDLWSTLSKSPRQELDFSAQPEHDSGAVFDMILDGEIRIRLHTESGSPMSAQLKNRLVRCAAFQNPKYFETLRLRLSTFNIPRVISCSVEKGEWLHLPRGCQIEAVSILRTHGATSKLVDSRTTGIRITATFQGHLSRQQQAVLDEIKVHETGVLSAPTGFGKTVLAAALIATRQVNTLVLVHRSQLVDQWRERLGNFLQLDEIKSIGSIGSGKRKPFGKVDIAMLQSLYRDHGVDPLVNDYGQIIVDECHHVAAFSFEQLMRQASPKYVLGLTATPIRRDGLHPIMFMQCGPLRVKVKNHPDVHSCRQVVSWRNLPISGTIKADSSITYIYQQLSTDAERTAALASDIVEELATGAYPLVLTERKAHIEAIVYEIEKRTTARIAVLHGGLGKKAKTAAMELTKAAGLDDGNQSASIPRIIIATGKFIGEGFDLPDLDSLFLALPIAWRGTLQQYVGRLTRDLNNKTEIRVYDYLDSGSPILASMAEKRRKGYRALGFTEKE
jgi:superfamily II DNA or RNA helicase